MLVALEQGSDLTSVLVTLAQVLLDPHYRTFDGFQKLVHREFLSFGHRFSHNGITEQNQTPLPVFLLFLSLVTDRKLNKSLIDYDYIIVHFEG